MQASSEAIAANEALIEQQQRLAEQLRDRADAAESAHAAASAQLSSSLEELRAAHAALEQKRAETEQLSLASTLTAEALENAHRDGARALEQLEEVSRAELEGRRRLDGALGSLGQARAAIEQLQWQLAESDELAERHRAVAEQRGTEAEAATRRASELDGHVEDLQQRCSAVFQAANEYKEVAASLESALKERQANLKELEDLYAASEANVHDLMQENQSLRTAALEQGREHGAAVAILEDRCRKAEEVADQLDRQVSAAMLDIEELRTQLREQQESLTSSETSARTMLADASARIESVSDEYSTTKGLLLTAEAKISELEKAHSDLLFTVEAAQAQDRWRKLSEDELKVKADSQSQLIADMKDELSQRAQAMQQLHESCAASEARAKALLAEVAQHRNALHDSELTSAALKNRLEDEAAQASRLQQRLRDSDAHSRTLQSQLDAAMNDVDSERRRAHDAEVRERHVEERLLVLQDELQAQSHERQLLDAESSRSARLQQERLEAEMSRTARLQQQISDAQADRQAESASLAQQLESMRQRAEDAEARGHRSEGRLLALQDELDLMGRDVLGRIAKQTMLEANNAALAQAVEMLELRAMKLQDEVNSELAGKQLLLIEHDIKNRQLERLADRRADDAVAQEHVQMALAEAEADQTDAARKLASLQQAMTALSSEANLLNERLHAALAENSRLAHELEQATTRDDARTRAADQLASMSSMVEDLAAGASELERHARTHAERIDASGHMAELERIAREAAEARALETEQQLVALQNEMRAVQLEKQVSSCGALVCDATGLD